MSVRDRSLRRVKLDDSRKGRFGEGGGEREGGGRGSIGSAEGRNRQTGPKWDDSEKEDVGGTLQDTRHKTQGQDIWHKTQDIWHKT